MGLRVLGFEWALQRGLRERSAGFERALQRGLRGCSAGLSRVLHRFAGYRLGCVDLGLVGSASICFLAQRVEQTPVVCSCSYSSC